MKCYQEKNFNETNFDNELNNDSEVIYGRPYPIRKWIKERTNQVISTYNFSISKNPDTDISNVTIKKISQCFDKYIICINIFLLFIMYYLL